MHLVGWIISSTYRGNIPNFVKSLWEEKIEKEKSQEKEKFCLKIMKK